MHRKPWASPGVAAVAALALLAPAGQAAAQSFQIEPAGAVLQGQPVTIRLAAVAPGADVEISAERRFGRPPLLYASSARFVADPNGEVNLATAIPVEGSYEGADAAGLFWSMTPSDRTPPETWRRGEVRLTARIDGIVVAEGSTQLIGGLAEVMTEAVPGFPSATLYRLPGRTPRPVVVVLHGADGGTGASERFGPKLASLGYAVVGLPYYSPDWGEHAPPKAIAELPGSFIDIRIDQIAELREWLRTRPEVDAERIALFGGSKGAEFALIAASKYPWLTSVVAIAPSDLVWEGWGLETIEAEGVRSSFSFEGRPLPFMPYVGFVDGLLAGPGADLLKIHEDGRAAHPEREADARIRIEDFPGPVMLVAGDADSEWKSGQMARNLAAARDVTGLDTTLLVYPDAGHDVSGDGWAPTIVGLDRGGGSASANARAQIDAWPQILAFLKRTLTPH
ncbi:acyl-CoA thioester hydrolase/BAAT C-terminal domain-containing protein [Brevundimonas lutea]|uniref:acyl-CoA thioester hydrolase/BAAT C-terminal domain-containing protein n=1 Tax=Brevundimonas lutea TaxID=2293980 RepID=UPI0013CE7032|nr:acyl-CoA thioester hydrolase/BAAT C-terminal domain-containing protein [Brevundimonas lutea]